MTKKQEDKYSAKGATEALGDQTCSPGFAPDRTQPECLSLPLGSIGLLHVFLLSLTFQPIEKTSIHSYSVPGTSESLIK